MNPEEEKSLLLSFFQQYPLITFESGERIIRPKELSSNVLYIKSGTVRISTFSPRGEEMTISYLNPKSYENVTFGLTPHDNPYYIEAFTKVEAWRVSRNEYLKFAKENPSIYINISESLLKLVQDLYEQIAWLKVGNAYTKIASAIYYFGKNLGQTQGTETKISIKITHQMIANLTGLTRETVSKQIKLLENRHLITYKDATLTIHDNNRLRTETEADYLLT